VGFVAIGAAITGTLVTDHGWHLLLALLVAGAIGSIVAAVIGYPALRVRGLFLAASTVAFGLVVSSLVLNQTYFDWLLPDGRVLRPRVFGLDLASDRVFYFFTFAILLLILGSVRSLRRSRVGRALIAARDNEPATRAFGINVTGVRLAGFAVAGFYAAVAGGLFALHQNAVIPTALDVQASLQIFVMVVIGGLGSVPGALLGAAYYFGARFFLPATWALLATGLGMLVLLMMVPGGLGQIAYGWRDGLLRWIAARRGIVVPSLVAEARPEDALLLGGTPAGASPDGPPAATTPPKRPARSRAGAK
jgi:branched-chain amino acid transport system permease protein